MREFELQTYELLCYGCGEVKCPTVLLGGDVYCESCLRKALKLIEEADND